MKKKQLLGLVLACAVLSSCSQPAVDSTDDTVVQTQPVGNEKPVVNTSDLFTDRDFKTGYEKGAAITLNGNTASCDSDAVRISGGTVTITDEGTYVLSGKLDDGMIVVNADKTNKVQLVLNGVSISSADCAPIYIYQADKVFLTLAENTENSLSNGGTFTAIDDNNIDAVIFSKEDLTLNGNGSLTVTSPAGHGIVSKDELKITGGNYSITAAFHGLSGKDNLCIAGGIIDITAGKDGMKAQHEEDSNLGLVYIGNGTFAVRAEGDGLSASGYMQILDGSFDIVTGGGSENGQKQTSDNWGGFMGGPPGMGGGRPGKDAFMQPSTETEEDSTSIKGIKASGDLVIHGGSFTIDSADDAVHSNADMTVNSGNFTIATGDDGFHADGTLTVTSGNITVTESYEGLEGLHIAISGGQIGVISGDDGLNAAGGTDQSGFGGNRGDKFGGPPGMGGMMGGSSSGSIVISGGKLHITASGDGIDANGTLTISGGYTVVCGPTQGDTATLDYDVSGMITGGTFIGTGASGMAQTFSDSEQGVIAISVGGSQAAGTAITLKDSQGNTVISHTPELTFSVVILSSPDIIKGKIYTITVGSQSGEFEAS